MFVAQPTSPFSSRFDITRSGRPIASVNMSWVREAGTMQVHGLTLEVGRDHWAGGDFYLSSGETRLAIAEKPSLFSRRFRVLASETIYELRAVSPLGRAFELRLLGRRIGTIRPTSFWGRGLEADLPDDLSEEVRAFMIWLVLLIWKRERNG